MTLEQHVNNSGFPLQLAIANRFGSRGSEWKVLYEEHAWSHDHGNGFIDLVLEDFNKTWLMNIECKRVRDSTWIFLSDRNSTSTRRVAKLWVSKKSSDNRLIHYDWVDMPMDPECVQSSYCIVPGQDPRSRPMLERNASTVVLSTEALASEEATHLSDQYSDLRIYQNVIVTTADLKVCKLDVNQIDLSSGELGDDAEFVDVPFVRFRKQLGASVSSDTRATSERDVRRLVTTKESTVFVVNSDHFEQFVTSCELPDDVGSYVRTR